MRNDEALMATLLEDACLTLDQLARACDVHPDWVTARMREGLLRTARSTSVAEWRFSSRDLSRVRTMQRIERDFDAVPELAALVADLIEELEDLRGELRHAAPR